METAEPTTREVGLGAGIESDRVGPVAQRDADQVVTCAREDLRRPDSVDWCWEGWARRRDRVAACGRYSNRCFRNRW